jgi:ribosome-binding protein aMBF1 (putative translation factor)
MFMTADPIHFVVCPQRKRAYVRGFTLRKVPRLTSTAPSRAEMQFFEDLITSLTARRKSLGLSQESLSQKLGASEGMVAKWETGHKMPSSFWLMCWCQALSVEVRVG